MSLYRRKVRGKDGVVQLSKVWTMRFMFEGQPVCESTRQTSKARARQVYDLRRQELKDGVAGIKKESKNALFASAAREWLDLKASRWSPNMTSISQYAVQHLQPTFGRKLLASIEATDIGRYQKLRLAEGASPRTVNIEVGVLRQIMKANGVWERVRSSPKWEHVGMLEEREDVGRALTPAEERSLLIECERSVSRVLLPFIILALETGARYNTIRTLTWAQVDFEARRLVIGKDKTKAGTGRAIPLSRRAFETLQNWGSQFPKRKPSHFVFPSESYGLHGEAGKFGGEVKPYAVDPTKPVGTIKSSWQSAKKRTRRHCPSCRNGLLADRDQAFYCLNCAHVLDELPVALSEVRLHDLRHSAVSRMVAARIPLTTIGKIVGWSTSTTVAMAARYSHPADDELRRAVEAISGGHNLP